MLVLIKDNACSAKLGRVKCLELKLKLEFLSWVGGWFPNNHNGVLKYVSKSESGWVGTSVSYQQKVLKLY